MQRRRKGSPGWGRSPAGREVAWRRRGTEEKPEEVSGGSDTVGRAGEGSTREDGERGSHGEMGDPAQQRGRCCRG